MAYVHRTDPELRRALERWIGADQEAMTRLDAVRLAAEIGRLAREVLDQRVLEARAFNHSWTHIADAVGITRQSAHKRWRHLEDPARALSPRSAKPTSGPHGGRPKLRERGARSVPAATRHRRSPPA